MTPSRILPLITVDKNPAYPKALSELKEEGALPAQSELRQVKYLNNLVEQDHRFIKRLVKPELGFFSFDTAWGTVQGYEVMHDSERPGERGSQRGCQRTDNIHR